jgi:hypothetical protein
MLGVPLPTDRLCALGTSALAGIQEDSDESLFTWLAVINISLKDVYTHCPWFYPWITGWVVGETLMEGIYLRHLMASSWSFNFKSAAVGVRYEEKLYTMETMRAFD